MRLTERKKEMKSDEVALSRWRLVRGCERELKKETTDLKAENVGGGGAGLHGVQVNVPVIRDAGRRGGTRFLPPI